MVRITKSERKAILTRYPDAWIFCTRHHAFLAGYDTAPPSRYLDKLRGGQPTTSVHQTGRGKR